MKVSGFTFIRNGQQLGFPFIESIRSILPICDEMIINVGTSNDQTLEMIRQLNEPKIKIIETTWNDRIRTKGFVYGQQKMIAQYSCTGDWAFYLEGDEIVHEKDLSTIRQSMERHLDDPNVEALVFDYLHFYGNTNTYAWSPHWYRRAPRIIKTTVRNFAPGGLYWTVLDHNTNKKARYPKAAPTGATIYHYGWVRSEVQTRQKLEQTVHLWNKDSNGNDLEYSNIDPYILKRFTGTHPKVIEGFFPQEEGVFQTNPDYKLTANDYKNRFRLLLERYFGWETSKKHSTLTYKS